MYNALQKKEAPKVDPAPAQAAKGADKKSGLKSMNYSDQKVALKPKAGGQQDGLSPAEIQSAIKYNNKRGYSLAEIKKFQKEVGTSADGVIGPNTIKAIAKFQSGEGLSADGKIGPKTEKALNAAIAQGQKPNKPKPDKPKDPPPAQSGQLTAHFSLAEFKSKDGAPTPASVIPILKELAQNLEVLRTAVGGKSISINSGYRSPAHNAAVGGVKNSQHVQGRAADIVVSGMTPAQVYAKIVKLIDQGKMKQGGVGKYSSFVHYDTRGNAARW